MPCPLAFSYFHSGLSGWLASDAFGWVPTPDTTWLPLITIFFL